MKMKNIIIAVAALALGASAGWFVRGVGEWGTGNGRARCPQRADDGGLGQAPLIGHPLRGRTSSGGYALPVDGNGQDARSPGKLSRLRRKATIRSSSDVDVQRRILKANIAALEKRLAAAKKEAAAIAEARAALKASGETSHTDLLQWADARKKLKEEGKRETVGEMRRLAPGWFENLSRWTLGKGDVFRRRTVEMLEILSVLDVSERSESEREVHAKYMEVLANAAQRFDEKVDAATDDTSTDEFFGINNEMFVQTGKSLGKDKLQVREQKMLRDLTARNLGFSEEEMSEMMSAVKEASAAQYASVPNMNQGLGSFDAKKGKGK